MKRIAVFLIAALMCISCVNILWFFFPELTIRNYILVLPIPLIILSYFLCVEQKNILYLLALVGFMIGDYCFIIEEDFINGITSCAIGLSLYGIIVLWQGHYISTRRLLVSAVPFVIMYMSPFFFFVDKIEDNIFSEVVFYTSAVGFFSLMSIIAYVSKRDAVTMKLLAAGVTTTLMGITYGVYLFLGYNALYIVIADMLFMYSNFKMWQYIIIKDEPLLTTEEI
ncbi:MAG: hypothetical protein AAF611_07050 [Bacteroidota bacterium]